MLHWTALQYAPRRNERKSARACSSSLTSTTHFGIDAPPVTDRYLRLFRLSTELQETIAISKENYEAVEKHGRIEIEKYSVNSIQWTETLFTLVNDDELIPLNSIIIKSNKNMAQGKKTDNEIVLNHWELHLEPWCPAQIFYYFKDNDGGRWLIYLRWSGQRGDEPWSAELLRCDENWKDIPDSSDNVNLLEEMYHTPGTIKGYYYDEEYPFLMERVLEIVREMKPELKDLLI